MIFPINVRESPVLDFLINTKAVKKMPKIKRTIHIQKNGLIPFPAMPSLLLRRQRMQKFPQNPSTLITPQITKIIP